MLNNRNKTGIRTGAGFTLVEMLLVMALFTIVFGVGLSMGFDTYRENSLKEERDTLISVLQKARSQAINNINNTQHGFYFNGTDYVLFEGPSYALRDNSRDLIISKENSSIAISGLTEIVFEQLTGDINSIGDITLTDNSNASSITLSFNQEGRINW